MWQIVGGFSGFYRHIARLDATVHVLWNSGRTRKTFYLVEGESVAAITVLAATDLYSALDEADELISETATRGE